MIELSQQPVYFVIQGSDLILWSSSVLNFLNLVDNISRDLFSPFFTFIKVINLPNMSEPTRTLIFLFIVQRPFHSPPSV